MGKQQFSTIWLVWCVLLLYQDLTITALTVHRLHKSENKKNKSDGGGNIKALSNRNGDFVTPSGRCADWERYDGQDCVCANNCEGHSGIVCDEHGNQYRSLCDFVYNICSQKIQATTRQKSCGSCETLRLTGGSLLPEHPEYGLGIFHKNVEEDTWIAEDESSAEVRLFYAKEIKKWVVGPASNSSEGSIILHMDADHPQDSRAGALIARKNGSHVWLESDPFLHFECLSESPVKRHRRGIFSLLLLGGLLFGIGTTTYSTTVSTVQAVKGCYYYPSVCRMRKTINRLKPEVVSLRDRFLSKFGDPQDFKEIADTVNNQTEKLKEMLSELHQVTGELIQLQSGMEDSHQDMSSYFSSRVNTKLHDEWRTGTAWGIFRTFILDIPLTSLLGSIAGAVSTALGALTSVVGIVFGVFTIMKTRSNERKIRDQMIDVRRDLYEARDKLNEAFFNMEQFQESFYDNVIYPMIETMANMSTYHEKYQKFYDSLTSSFQSSGLHHLPSRAVKLDTINKDTLSNLKNVHFPPLLTFLENEIENMKTRLSYFKHIDNITEHVRLGVQSQTYLGDIFQSLHESDVESIGQIFPTEFALLQFIANTTLNQRDCYWGYNLTAVRQDNVNEFSYKSAPVCMSREMEIFVSNIRENIEQNVAIDVVFSSMSHGLFESRYKKDNIYC